MKKALAGALASATFMASSLAHASGWPVFDAANFVKNTMTAAQALKTEIYENTNIVYQNKMMLNQLQQAVGLDVVAMAKQAEGIQEDIAKYQRYGKTLKDLYGSVADTADFLSNVQGLMATSGKSPDQWFRDQRTLLETGDKTAKRLFGLGQAVASNNQKLAKRRRDLQSDLELNQTAQATAQLTNQMLDVMAGQNADLLQLIGAKTEADAVKDQRANTQETERNDSGEKLQRDREVQLRELENRVFGKR
ncbi:conjugal transfer protein TrbJ [Cupriavidus taiwanensis]|uniref:conjugal transfer protein TrbJ n=1 Tax=Cupriavidus taiwanensis TaxID=164546 RepID=UPI00254048F5|nr:conjugal transfer protein TrbJ [Cupriavidus taiwanensis]MDK3022952.1 conjugal transfer protein TrbJ [Cupriavidus taiwanensis]